MSQRLLCCSGSLDGGGSERQLWQLVTGLDREVFLPHIYLLYRRGVFLERLPGCVPIVDFWGEHEGQRFLPGQIYRQQVAHLSDHIKQQSIDVVYDRTFHMTLLTSAACSRTRTPRVSVIVSPPSFDFARSKERFSFIKRWLLAKAYTKSFSRTVAVSPAVAADASTYYRIPRGRIEVVPSPVDVAGVEAAAQHDKSASDSSAFRIAVVGRQSKEKGQEAAIRAFAQALRTERDSDRKLAVLDLVGDGPERECLQSLVHQLSIAENVKFHGFLENPHQVIVQADLLFLPSEYEGLPNVLLEAMALGTPVLATRCSPSVETLIGDGRDPEEQRGLLVDVGNTQQMSHALAGIWRNPGLSLTRAERAKKYVLAHHDLPLWLKKMETLFSELLRDVQGRVL